MRLECQPSPPEPQQFQHQTFRALSIFTLTTPLIFHLRIPTPPLTNTLQKIILCTHYIHLLTTGVARDSAESHLYNDLRVIIQINPLYADYGSMVLEGTKVREATMLEPGIYGSWLERLSVLES